MNTELLILILIILIILLCYNNKHQYENFKAYNKIDKIYVINLKKNKDRYKKFMKNARKANVKVDRFNAVYGKELSKDHPDILKYFAKDHGLNPGQIGCALSHIKIWEDAIRHNYKNIIVFEDDAIIPEDFWEKFNNSYNELPKNWDMLLLGGTRLGGSIYSKNLLKPSKKSGNWGTSSLLINVNFLKKIIKDVKLQLPIDDYFINNYYYNKNFNIFIVKKMISKIDFSFNSDIGVGVQEKNYPIVVYK